MKHDSTDRPPPAGVDSATWSCARCGATMIGHRPAGDLCPDCAPPSLQALAAVLAGALATWAGRDDTRPEPAVRRAANASVDAIDDMLAGLHRARQQLLGEMRASDDAAIARVDALLAAGRAS